MPQTETQQMKTVNGDNIKDQTPFIQACYSSAAKVQEVLRSNYENMPEGCCFSPGLAALLVDSAFTHEEACWMAGMFIANQFEIYKNNQ